MKTNLESMSLFKRPRLQHITRLAVTALTAVMLSGLVAGCDQMDPVVDSPFSVVDLAPPVDDGGANNERDEGEGPSLVGLWDLIEYSRGGVELSVSGTYMFHPSGTLAISGQGSYPYTQDGNSVIIDEARYSLSFSGKEVTLTRVDAALIYTLNAIH